MHAPADGEHELHDDAEDALAAGQVGEPERLEAAAAEPRLGRVGGHFAVAVLRPFPRHVEAPVAVKADEVAVRAGSRRPP